jgi:pyruvate dehydrogenase E2 component (dihydrolipoamide acetyltransferase)
MSDIQLSVPDLGDDGTAEVIEILFSVGDQLNQEDIVVVLESDKATMEIPTEHAGSLSQLHVSLGDEVSTGDLLATISSGKSEETQKEESDTLGVEEQREEPKEGKTLEESSAEKESLQSKQGSEPRLEIETVPDMGEGSAELIEILCAQGDQISKDDILFILESDKATMEIPASFSGEITQIFVSLGDQLGFGDQLVEISTSDQDENIQEAPLEKEIKPDETRAVRNQAAHQAKAHTRKAALQEASYRNPDVHSGPAARRLARELGVDLSLVKPSGPKERILKDDIKAFVKANLGKGGASSANPIFEFELPEIDFTKFGEIEKQKLTRIKKVSAKNLSRSWLTIPHVTQFDEADITELEAFRKSEGPALKEEGIKITPLAFLVKASAEVLKSFPRFNASLDKSGEQLILKKYFHIGVAVDTEDGLVVPVIRNANAKSVKAIAQELAEISEKARNKKLMPQDMQGACFSISSLGGIGGTAFTPIVNWPEVAILGVSRSQMKPVYDGESESFVPRLILPLSLSYDHRVIDGAEAARFSRAFAELLQSDDFLKLD